jgi:hypothetical protein
LNDLQAKMAIAAKTSAKGTTGKKGKALRYTKFKAAYVVTSTSGKSRKKAGKASKGGAAADPSQLSQLGASKSRYNSIDAQARADAAQIGESTSTGKKTKGSRTSAKRSKGAAMSSTTAIVSSHTLSAFVGLASASIVAIAAGLLVRRRQGYTPFEYNAVATDIAIGQSSSLLYCEVEPGERVPKTTV